MRFVFILLAFAFLSSCCEPPIIENLIVCNERVSTLPNPPTCRNANKIIDKDKAFTASFSAYSIRMDSPVRFYLFDKTNDTLIDEAIGILSDFGGAFRSTERCLSFVAYTFELPDSGYWPDTILIEVHVDDMNETLMLAEEFIPI